jgi:excisionase family DNA binding protein
VVEPLFTARELAARLQVSARTIREAAASGELATVRIGYQRRFAASAVRAWLELRDGEPHP